VFKIDI